MSSKAMLLALLAAAMPAQAQEKVSERRPAAPDGIVEIENPAGSVRVTGWERGEVEVTGTLGSGADGLEWESSAKRTHIEIETHGNPNAVRSDLEVHVPAGSRVRVESFAATISVTDVKGSVHAETVQGSISVSGSADEVGVETVNGSIDVSGHSKEIKAEAVNGSVSVSGFDGDVEASTVNGSLTVKDGTLRRGRLETVNGRILFDGAFAGHASLDVESVGGSVELWLPADLSADFGVSSFSGSIDMGFGAPEPRRERHGPQKELSFTVGAGDAKVRVETLSGSVEIKKK